MIHQKFNKSQFKQTLFLEQYINEPQKTQELQQFYQKFIQNVIKFVQGLKQMTLTPIYKFLFQYRRQKIKQIYTINEILSILFQRIDKLIKNKNAKKNWNSYDIILLLWFISKYMQKNGIQRPQNLELKDWQQISSLIPGINAKKCMFKFVSLQKTKLSFIKWSKEEQAILRLLVEKYGINNWKIISQQLYLQNTKDKIYRSPKQCRQHWNCFLNPILKKGPWRLEQDIKLFQIIKQNKGYKRWCYIKIQFQGRTQNALKNRYNLLLQKQKKKYCDKNQNQLIDQFLQQKCSQFKHVNKQNQIIIKQQMVEQVKEKQKQVQQKKFYYKKQKQVLINLKMNSFRSSFKVSPKFIEELQTQSKNFCKSNQYCINLGSKIFNESFKFIQN